MTFRNKEIILSLFSVVLFLSGLIWNTTFNSRHQGLSRTLTSFRECQEGNQMIKFMPYEDRWKKQGIFSPEKDDLVGVGQICSI